MASFCRHNFSIWKLTDIWVPTGAVITPCLKVIISLKCGGAGFYVYICNEQSWLQALFFQHQVQWHSSIAVPVPPVAAPRGNSWLTSPGGCRVQCSSLKHSVAVTQCSIIAPGVLGHAIKALHPTVLQEREHLTHWIIGVLTNEALMAARGERPSAKQEGTLPSEYLTELS